MKIPVGSSVKIVKTNETKVIIDSEIICDSEVYYMSDNTSYSLNQITLVENQKISYREFIGFYLKKLKCKIENDYYDTEYFLHKTDFSKLDDQFQKLKEEYLKENNIKPM